MKTTIPFAVFLTLILFNPFQLFAQTCDDPIVIIDDDIESYNEGEVSDQSPHWEIWPGATLGGIVSTEQASSGEKSIKLIGGADQDVLLLLGDSTSGHYRLSWEMYIPEGHLGTFGVQHNEMVPSHGLGLGFYQGEGGILGPFQTDKLFSYPEAEWFDVIFLLDIDNDFGRVIIDEYTYFEYTFSTNNDMLSQLGAINFWPPTPNFFTGLEEVPRDLYIDNIRFEQIPAPETGQYCYTGVPITPGTHTVPDLTCYGGGYDLGGGDGAEKGYWYVYEPAEDGIISIATCENGVDTRGWILTGTDCKQLEIVGVNDDQCDMGTGQEWATYREAVVKGGETYYIMWDNAWEALGFDFTLNFTTEPGLPGDFCETAIPIQPGEHEIQEITGNASMTGPDINTFTTSVTPYAQTRWYSYTPTTGGQITISSCNFAASDTRVWVYTGECGTYESLELLASNDDGCGALGQTLLDSLIVEPGTTYYIEWDDRLSDDPFIWELQLEEAITVNVTFNVVMSLEPFVNANGVHIAGSFNDWTPDATPLTDNGDGSWSITLQLPSFATYEYKFINGNMWGFDELDITEECGVLGGAGSFDRVFTIPDNAFTDISTPFYCFNTCEDCAGLVSVDEHVLAAGFEAYPNPALDQLVLDFDFSEQVDDLNVEMFNSLGLKVMERKLHNVSTQILELDVSTFANGIYLIKLSAENIEFSKMITIQE